MNALRTLAAALLSTALLAGCSDADPIGPQDPTLNTNAQGVDRLPPLPFPPPADRPPIEFPPEDPPIDEPPVEDPVRPLPPIDNGGANDDDGGGGGGIDRPLDG
jgi:hypothetical protein